MILCVYILYVDPCLHYCAIILARSIILGECYQFQVRGKFKTLTTTSWITLRTIPGLPYRKNCKFPALLFTIRRKMTVVFPIFRNYSESITKPTAKIPFLTFKFLHNLTASYIQDLFIRHCPMRSLWSSSPQRLSRANFNLMAYSAGEFASCFCSRSLNHLPIDINTLSKCGKV